MGGPQARPLFHSFHISTTPEIMRIELTEAQATALDQAATAEMRTRQQMLSLLLAEALRFYFMDREPVLNANTLQPDQLCEALLNDALEQVQIREIL